MFEAFPYLSLTQFGKVYGVSATEFGKWLQQIGWRDESFQPYPKLFEAGVCKYIDSEGGRFVAWEQRRTKLALIKAGLVSNEEHFPVGSFSMKDSGNGIFEINDHNGNVCLRVTGTKFAHEVKRLLDFAHEHGEWFTDQFWAKKGKKKESVRKPEWQDKYD